MIDPATPRIPRETESGCDFTRQRCNIDSFVIWIFTGEINSDADEKPLFVVVACDERFKFTWGEVQ
ncbi:hypothetical protein BRD14_06725 [Halobacteriales archaeon SW_5_68_122]|nr:MAG: hypothetical protein BRD14_06725 [Halobacteriales archaeon SW_5_68_122]